MSKTKYEELQALRKKYGEETSTFVERVHDIGPKIVAAYSTYLGGPDGAAAAVPPKGDFSTDAEYSDAAFDSYGRGAICLEPIRMGICTEIGNQSDDGATWVRTIIEFHPSGRGLQLTIGNRAHKFYIDAGLNAYMSDICEAIFQDVREAFSVDLDRAQGRSQIGFTFQPK